MSFGKKGEGPEEFKFPRGLAVGSFSLKLGAIHAHTFPTVISIKSMPPISNKCKMVVVFQCFSCPSVIEFIFYGDSSDMSDTRQQRQK